MLLCFHHDSLTGVYPSKFHIYIIFSICCQCLFCLKWHGTMEHKTYENFVRTSYNLEFILHLWHYVNVNITDCVISFVNYGRIKIQIYLFFFLKMFINDVNKKEEIKAIAIRHLRKYGIKFRLKNTRPVQVIFYYF